MMRSQVLREALCGYLIADAAPFIGSTPAACETTMAFTIEVTETSHSVDADSDMPPAPGPSPACNSPNGALQQIGKLRRGKGMRSAAAGVVEQGIVEAPFRGVELPCELREILPVGAQARPAAFNTLTPILKELEGMGYLRRQRDSADERQVLVSLTDAGRRLREKGLGMSLVEASGLT
jgi:transcription regulator SarA/Rot-like protein